MARSYEGKVTFFGVAWAASEQECREYVDRYDVPYDNALDAEERVFADYGVAYQPATVFVSADGRIVDRLAGGMDADELERRVRRLLEA